MHNLFKYALSLLLLGSSATCAPKTASFSEAASAAKGEAVLTRSRLLMGHVPVNISVKFPEGDRERALLATEAAYELAQNLENLLSEWCPGSEISCLNRMAGKGSCGLSAETLELLQRSILISNLTGSAFDIRFASPSPGGRRGEIRIDAMGRKASLPHPETRIGVSSIAKGFIVDKMVELLRSKGFSEVIIDAGGDTRAEGGPWKVAFQKPLSGSLEILLPQEVTDRALGSSGLYEQGRHIVDPRTGKAIDRGGSVTVFADNLSLASALATGFFVLGETDSQAYLEKFPGIQVYWIDPDGGHREYRSRSAANRIPISGPSDR
jgi:Membrane-associated lipoprotein involved in thiamine biosynthesis